jgi:hypothetical protein
MTLYLGEASKKRRNQIIGGVVAVLILSFLIAFWQDIINFKDILSNLIDIVLRKRSLLEWATPNQVNSLLILFFTCGLGFLGVFFLWLFLLAAQAILPVEGFIETYRTAWHLLLYMLHLHGPAISVRDGQVISTKEDIREGPGVVVVDFNSAIVLESRIPLPGMNRLFFNTAHTILQIVGLADKFQTPRTAGPGIVFTARGEKIRGAVDLRKQFRIQPGITAYTSDGIEVSASVFSMFTIGEPAEVLQVTYDGDPRPENLRVVTLEPVPEGHFRITGMSNELEENDRNEIHHFANLVRHNGSLKPYSKPLSTNTPPIYQPERVFAAVFSEARSENNKTLSWYELPARVAASLFREILSQVKFDNLFSGGKDEISPRAKYKSELRLALRNNGILSYRLLFHTSDKPLERRKVYLSSDLRISEIRPLVFPKILRDRGIKIIMASFGEIIPVNSTIYNHRFETWKANWLRDIDFINAEKELDADRMIARARALAQRDIAANLNIILQQTDLPREILAVRILQAIENLAADGKTKDLLPGGTLDIINSARYWLIPGSTPPMNNPSPGEGREQQ